jgi:acyl-CoA synthetase (AMP-forming)/AMP-acid ligase II
MLGQMMHRPLSIIEILRFAAEIHKTAEIVSVRTEGDMHRYTYPDAYARVGQLANALQDMGIEQGIVSPPWHGMGIATLNSIMRSVVWGPCVTRSIHALARNRWFISFNTPKIA